MINSSFLPVKPYTYPHQGCQITRFSKKNNSGSGQPHTQPFVLPIISVERPCRAFPNDRNLYHKFTVHFTSHRVFCIMMNRSAYPMGMYFIYCYCQVLEELSIICIVQYNTFNSKSATTSGFNAPVANKLKDSTL